MNTAVVPHANGHADGALSILLHLEAAGACTPVALDLSGVDLDLDGYAAILGWLGAMYKRIAWYTGDALLEGEQRFGEAAFQVADALGMSERTMLNRRWVCSRIPPVRRLPGLSFSHHESVAPLGPREQRRWLGEALREGWTREHLRARLRDSGALPRAGRVALGDAEANAARRLEDAVRGAVAAGRPRMGGWWVPAAAWTALMEAV